MSLRNDIMRFSVLGLEVIEGSNFKLLWFYRVLGKKEVKHNLVGLVLFSTRLAVSCYATMSGI